MPFACLPCMPNISHTGLACLADGHEDGVMKNTGAFAVDNSSISINIHDRKLL